ncbi:MAG: ferritin family protein [Planctomycetaceae bacterium]|nr:ferritin family protein [Planctomycetaceae bacterium]
MAGRPATDWREKFGKVFRGDYHTGGEDGSCIMGIELTANDVIALAEQIEKAACNFYARAAKAVGDRRTRQLLSELAALEQVHEDIFSGLRLGKETLPARIEAAAGPISAEVGMLARGLEETLGEVAASQSSAEMLRRALAFEQDSVKFFQGMRKMLPRGAAQKRVDAIIEEEVSHVLMISSALNWHGQADA